MTFGQAIEIMKQGGRVAREGWNGKGMWIAIASSLGGPSEGAMPVKVALVDSDVAVEKIRPCVYMKDAQGFLVPGWLASQTDMLSEDWSVVDED